jgi:hypothetical protein
MVLVAVEIELHWENITGGRHGLPHILIEAHQATELPRASAASAASAASEGKDIVTFDEGGGQLRRVAIQNTFDLPKLLRFKSLEHVTSRVSMDAIRGLVPAFRTA